MRTYKLCLIGPANSGKTRWVNKLIGWPNVATEPTMGTVTTGVTVIVDGSPVKFNIWDCAGNPSYTGLGDGYYIGADCAIVMADLDDSRNWVTDFTRVCSNAPYVITPTGDGALEALARVLTQ